MKTWLKTVFGVTTLVALALVVICIVLRPSRVYSPEGNTGRSLTLKDILNGTFSYKTYFPNWISEQEYLHQSEDDNIVFYNIETRESYIILSNSTMKSVNATDYGLSPDRQFIYLESDYSKLWRYSYTATYYIYDLQNGTRSILKKAEQDGLFFVSTPAFSQDAASYYKIFSDKDGYKHIHYIKDTVENAIQITSGKWEAIYIFRVTQDSLFYSSNEFEGYPGRRNIYRISIGNSPPSKKCVTCHLRKERCQYYTASFSYKAKYYALICYGPGLPISTLHDGRTDQEIQVLEENKELENALRNIQLPAVEIKKLEDGGMTFWYKMILPPQFDRSKKYPLLIQVYGGPCSQSVKSVFSVNWITYLASKEGIVVALVDGRGTAFQGDKFLHAVYRKLGVYEVEDQLTAVRKFIEMGFIDEGRIAIWGWSYGGYVSSLALASGTGLFKCGIAVAPVSSWEYYASIYTERFMGLPTKDDNLEHYKNSTVMARAEYFRNVDYLLIHGTADDNVHFQNSAQIAKALVNAQVDFQAMWYSDQNHGISSGRSQNHLYTHMTHFLKQCFSLSD